MARPTLKAQAAADFDLLIDGTMPWTINCIYTPIESGIPAIIPCFLSGMVDTFGDIEHYVGRGESNAEIYIWVKKSDVTDPKWRDVYVIDGSKWYYGSEGIVKSDEYSIKIHLMREFICD